MVFLGEKYVRNLRKMKNKRNALIKKHINNLPLARQFALNFKCLAEKNVM